MPFEEDFLKQDAITTSLLRAIEQCINIANHIVKKLKLGIPKHSRDSFMLLAKEKIIPAELADKLGRMISFRNIAVHQYQELDIKVFVDVIENHIDDLIMLSDCALKS